MKFILAIAILLGGMSLMTQNADAASMSACNKYVPLFVKYHLPVSTFKRIAYRESGCNAKSFVIDRDDAGGGLLGINLKGKLAVAWKRLCGVTLSTVTFAEVNIRCAGKAYHIMGLRPWALHR
jgi:hypothetical protein